MPLDASHDRDAVEPRDTPLVMVTGATGFIGSQVVSELAARGRDVLAVTRRTEAFDDEVAPASESDADGEITFVECNLLDRAATLDLVKRHRPTACVHAAWDVSAADYMSSDANQAWVRASLHLAQTLMQHGCEWLGVCGTHIEPPETCGPSNRYAAAKATLRHRLFDIASVAKPPMAVAWFHIFQPYGPGERTQRLLPSMIAAAATGGEFELKHPHALRDFIHVDDIASAIASACEQRLNGRFDVGTGRVRFLHEIAAMVERLAGGEPCVRWRERTPGEQSIDPVNRVANIQPLADETGWSPSIDLESGLRDLVQHHVSRLERSA